MVGISPAPDGGTEVNVVKLIAASTLPKDRAANWHRFRVSGLCKTCHAPFSMALMGRQDDLEREPIECDHCLDKAENAEAPK